MSCDGVDFEGDYFYFYAVKDLKKYKTNADFALESFRVLQMAVWDIKRFD